MFLSLGGEHKLQNRHQLLQYVTLNDFSFRKLVLHKSLFGRCQNVSFLHWKSFQCTLGAGSVFKSTINSKHNKSKTTHVSRLIFLPNRIIYCSQLIGEMALRLQRFQKKFPNGFAKTGRALTLKKKTTRSIIPFWPFCRLRACVERISYCPSYSH